MPDLSAFDPIPEMDGFFLATNGKLNCIAIQLSGGGLGLYSPVTGLGDAAMRSLSELGQVEALLAPNHYHNKAVPDYHAAFANARLVAPSAAVPRLSKVTDLSFANLEDDPFDLPTGARFVYPDGLKTGEVWIVTSTGLVVVDAFAGPGKTGNVPSLLKTFPNYGVSDKAQYQRWFFEVMSDVSLTRLVPCHGRMVTDTSLNLALEVLVREL